MRVSEKSFFINTGYHSCFVQTFWKGGCFHPRTATRLLDGGGFLFLFGALRRPLARSGSTLTGGGGVEDCDPIDGTVFDRTFVVTSGGDMPRPIDANSGLNWLSTVCTGTAVASGC